MLLTSLRLVWYFKTRLSNRCMNGVKAQMPTDTVKSYVRLMLSVALEERAWQSNCDCFTFVLPL